MSLSVKNMLGGSGGGASPYVWGKYEINPPRIPSDYQEVEYIESHGTEYIDTGYKITNDNFKAIVDVQYTSYSSEGYILGVLNNSIPSRFNIGVYNSNYYSECGDNASGQSNGVATNSRVTQILEKVGNTVTYTVNNNSVTITNTGTIQSGYNLAIFARNRYGTFDYPSHAKLYSIELYSNGELVKHYVPCYRKLGNVVGMYDTVSNTFYANSGTGTFNKGNNVEPPKPFLEYVTDKNPNKYPVDGTHTDGFSYMFGGGATNGKVLTNILAKEKIDRNSFCSVFLSPDTVNGLTSIGNPYSNDMHGCCRIDENRFFMIYPVYSNCRPTAVIITVDDNGVATASTPVQLTTSGTGNSGNLCACTLMPDGTILIAMGYQSNYWFRVSVGDDNSITLLESATVSTLSANTYPSYILPFSNTRALFVSGVYYQPKARFITIDGASITPDDTNYYISNDTGFTCYHSGFVKLTENKYLYGGCNSSNYRLRAIVFEVDEANSTITLGTLTSLTARASEDTNKALCYDGENVWCVYKGNTSSHYCYVSAYRVEGLTITTVKDEYINGTTNSTAEGNTYINGVATITPIGGGNLLVKQTGGYGFLTLDPNTCNVIDTNKSYSLGYYIRQFTSSDALVLLGATNGARNLGVEVITPLVPVARKYNGKGLAAVSLAMANQNEYTNALVPK